MTVEDKISIQSRIRSIYPDAKAWKYAPLWWVIWCPKLNKRLSDYFKTEEEAWEDAFDKVVITRKF
jgi:hypothetical protein